jgi:hypothetical protein
MLGLKYLDVPKAILFPGPHLVWELSSLGMPVGCQNNSDSVNVYVLNKLTANRFIHVEPLVGFDDLCALQEGLAVDAVPLWLLVILLTW